MRMTGVRPGSLTTSRVAPGREGSFARAQRSNSATASLRVQPAPGVASGTGWGAPYVSRSGGGSAGGL
jgi:hypothetical protein